jgi:hypothetical protein
MDLMMSNPDLGVAVVGKMDLSNRANSAVAWKTVWSFRNLVYSLHFKQAHCQKIEPEFYTFKKTLLSQHFLS